MSEDMKAFLCLVTLVAGMFFVLIWDSDETLDIRISNELNFPMLTSAKK